jgi:predicted Zn-dependent protease
VDDPTLASFQGVRCVGHYHYDDEGSAAEKALLIEEGILKGFLTTRAKIPSKSYQANGHARNKGHQRPVSRMAVTVVSSSQGVSLEDLREQLIAEIKAQDRPFGIIIYDTAGGETETSTYDFQAFSGQIMWATLIYPDGREEPVGGVDLVGTPLQALSNIIAVGKDLEVDNAYCGAESGSIPVTTISPAVLLKNVELQSKDEQRVTPYLLESPLKANEV